MNGIGDLFALNNPGLWPGSIGRAAQAEICAHPLCACLVGAGKQRRTTKTGITRIVSFNKGNLPLIVGSKYISHESFVALAAKDISVLRPKCTLQSSEKFSLALQLYSFRGTQQILYYTANTLKLLPWHLRFHLNG